MNQNLEIFNSIILSENKSRFWKFLHVTEKIGLPVQRPSFSRDSNCEGFRVVGKEENAG
jgi:hypothetical protein